MCNRLSLLWMLACAAILPAHAGSDEAGCRGHYSVLRTPPSHCPGPPLQTQPSRIPAPATTSDSDPIDPHWLKAEMLAFSVIGIAQVRGGTELLGNIWYAGAAVLPPFMTADDTYGPKKNYLAIAPPFVALGVMNGWLHRDGAEAPRIFLSNFIGFNVGMLWSRKVLREPRLFFGPYTSATLSFAPAGFSASNPDGGALQLTLRF